MTNAFGYSLFSAALVYVHLTAGSIGYGVQINEIMYHPAHGIGESEDTRREYIELYNDGSYPEDLAGWRISRGVDYEFPVATLLQPGQYLVVASDVSEFRRLYPDVSNVVGPWSGHLSNSGEAITLTEASGTIVDEVDYCDEGDWSYRQLAPVDHGYTGWEWANEHDGGGKSLEVICPGVPNEYGQNWRASLNPGGTPGRANSVLSADVAPFILGLAHKPIIPTSSEPVTISARILKHAAGPITVEVFYRVDGSAAFDFKPMAETRTQGGGQDGDSVYAAVLPSQPHGTIVEFYVKATDSGGRSRTWPGPTGPDGGQRANALCQVDDSFDASATWIPGSQPVYYLVLTAVEKAQFEKMWTTANTDAAMNGTFVSRDGTGVQCRYTAGIRNRGNIRGSTPISFRANFTHDNPWGGVTALDINSKYPYSQLMGSAIFKMAGLTAADVRAVQLRVNGRNLASLDDRMYGSYVAVEVLDSDFADHHFPRDAAGNLYRLKDASNTGVPGLAYEGEDAQAYRDTCFKQTNEASDDWQDLIHLTYVLNHLPQDGSLDQVRSVLDLNQWVRFLAVDTLAGNLEGGLTSGRGDDVALYRGIVDPRFVLIPRDLDTVLGQGDLPPDVGRSVFSYEKVQGLHGLLNHPEVVRLYYQQLAELTGTLFSPSQFDPLARQLLASWVPQAKIDEIRKYARDRSTRVLDQVERELTIVCDLPSFHDWFYTTVPEASLHGTADAIRTQSVYVNGKPARWDQRTGSWAVGTGLAPPIALSPGVNRIRVQALDGPEGAGQECQTGYVDIWYDCGSAKQVSGTLGADTTWDGAWGPWHVVGDVTVPAGITLTILAGTTVFFDPNTALLTHGRLLAAGDPYALIRFTRTPSCSGTWNGIQFVNTLQDNQILHAVVEYGRTDMGMVGIENSVALLDGIVFDHTDRNRVRTVNSSTIVQHSVFTDIFPPGGIPSSDNQSEQILGMGIAANGQLIIRNNVFGTTRGHNDVLDITGPIRPGPVAQILDNVFRGGGDELLDLGGDAYIEGNVFVHTHKDEYNLSAGYSNAISTGDDNAAAVIDVVRNIFYDVDHAVNLKNDTFMFFEHNLVMGIPEDSMGSDTRYSAIPFFGPGSESQGRGAFLSGNVFADIPQRIFDNVDESSDAGSNFVTDLSMQYTLIEPARAADRVGRQSRAILSLGLGNLAGDPRIEIGKDGESFIFKAGSCAVGNGPNGSDMGPFIPAGARVSGEPQALTSRSDATLHVSGPGITHYKHWVNHAPISAEIQINVPIQLNGLPDGDYTVYVVGRNAAGVWQDTERPTVSETWTVSALSSRVLINEVLAINDLAVECGGRYPGLVELYNPGAARIELGGLCMTDDLLQPAKFVFPKGLSIQPAAYLVLCADANQAMPGIHLGFSLDGSGGSLYLLDPEGNILDGVEFGPQIPNRSIGRVGHFMEWTLTSPTLGSPNRIAGLGDPSSLVINEWLAHGEVAFADDFVEIYNPDPLPVPLGGLYLTDNPNAEPNKHEIRSLSFISGGGYTVFTADGRPEDGPSHMGFRLSASQGMLGLFTADHRGIDTVIYGPQTSDASQGRSPDGAEDLAFLTLPTPGMANVTRTVQTRTVTLIAIDDRWSYDDSDVDWGAKWRQPGFEAAQTWPQGQALLGGEYWQQSLPEPVNTEISSDATTCYFRKTVNLDLDPACVDVLEISAIVDDGAVFYLNGAEVLRLGMDGAVDQAGVSHDRYANRNVSRPSYEGPFRISPDSLQRGDNVMAVEVHQSAADSAQDILFGLELDVVSTQTVPQNDPLENLLALLQGLRITEIMYSPIGGSDYEFVEFQNTGRRPLELAGVRATRGIHFTFPEMTLAAGEYVLIVTDVARFRARYGGEARIAGEYDGNLDNGGESILIQLPAPMEAAILRCRHEDSWFPETDGRGYSLVIRSVHASANTWSSSESWCQSEEPNGSPGH